MCRAGFDKRCFQALKKHGFLDAGTNPDLKEILPDEYYRNTFHTAKYLREHWGKLFKIMEIVPGYIGNQQDLIVLRKV